MYTANPKKAIIKIERLIKKQVYLEIFNSHNSAQIAEKKQPDLFRYI
jgi:hypothetical protein